MYIHDFLTYKQAKGTWTKKKTNKQKKQKTNKQTSDEYAQLTTICTSYMHVALIYVSVSRV